MRRFLILFCVALVACEEADAARMGKRSRGAPRSGAAGGGLDGGIPGFDPNQRLIIVNAGQSNGCGSTDDAGYSPTQPYDNRQGVGDALPLLIEVAGESPMSGTANQLGSLRATQRNTIVVQACAAGTRFDQVMDGSTPFTGMMTQLQRSKVAAPDATVGAITVPQGEDDTVAGTSQATVTAELLLYRHQLEDKMHADGTLEASRELVMLLDEQPSWTGDDVTGQPTVLLAQQAVEAAEPQHFIVTGGKYHLPHINGLHTSSLGRLIWGEQLGKIVNEVLFSGTRFERLKPRSAVADGNYIRLYMIVPCLRYAAGSRCGASPPIAFDTTTVSDRTYQLRGIWKGIKYRDSSSTGVAPYIITDPTIPATCPECAADEWRIDILLDKPARTTGEIGIADRTDSGLMNSCTSHTLGAGCAAASNIRDTDNTASQHAAVANLYNWAGMSRTPITGGTAPNAADDAVVLARPWTNMWYPVTGCTASPGYTPFLDQIGTMDVAIDSLVRDYSCGTTISGMSAKGIGSAQIGVANTWNTGACWSNNGTDVTWNGIADGEDFVFSVAFLDPTGHAANSYLAGWTNSSTEYIRVIYGSAETIGTRFRESAMAAEYIGSTSLTLTIGALHYCSVYVDTDTGGGFPQSHIFCDANAEVVSAVGANAPGAFATTGDFVLGGIPSSGTCLTFSTTIQFGFLGIGLGTAGSSWFNHAAHMRDCKAMGVAACQ